MPFSGTLWCQGERSPWSPDFSAKPLSAAVVQTTNPQVSQGAQFFHSKGCEYCHAIAGNGGYRGPDLTAVAGRLTRSQITLRILNGGYNMPSFASSLKPEEVNAIVAFLATRGPAGQGGEQATRQ